MTDNQPIKIDFGLPLAVIGTLVCLVIWGFSHNRRLDDMDRRLADLATQQSVTDLKAAEALADLVALRKAILEAMGRTNFVGRGLTYETNYLPRWTTNNVIRTDP